MQQLSDDRRRWLALITVCFAQLMITVDTSIVNVALPQIQHDLHFSQSSLTWVVNAFLVTFGSFLLLAGRLGDLAGRKRVFLAGLTVFTVASLLCGIADSSGLLIGARFLQGVGAAMQASVILAIIVTEFPEPEERAKAMSAWVFARSPAGRSVCCRRRAHPAAQLALDLLREHPDRPRRRSPAGCSSPTTAASASPRASTGSAPCSSRWRSPPRCTGSLNRRPTAGAHSTPSRPSPSRWCCSPPSWGSRTATQPDLPAAHPQAARPDALQRGPRPVGHRRVRRCSSSGSLYLEKVLGYGALDTGLAFLP